MTSNIYGAKWTKLIANTMTMGPFSLLGLRNVEAEISLDYLATGLPKAGDVIDGERFLDRASPWSLSFVVVLPLAPLAP